MVVVSGLAPPTLRGRPLSEGVVFSYNTPQLHGISTGSRIVGQTMNVYASKGTHKMFLQKTMYIMQRQHAISAHASSY